MKIGRNTVYGPEELRDMAVKAALSLVVAALYGIVWLFHTGHYLIASSIIALPIVLGITRLRRRH